MKVAAEIEALVNTFVAQVNELARRAISETVRGALGTASKTDGGTSGRQSNGELRERVLRTIAENPGSRTEQLGLSLRMPTKMLAPVIRKLVSDKAVKSKGQRRGMTYFAA